jgi:hypothetical protein
LKLIAGCLPQDDRNLLTIIGKQQQFPTKNDIITQKFTLADLLPDKQQAPRNSSGVYSNPNFKCKYKIQISKQKSKDIQLTIICLYIKHPNLTHNPS